MWLWRPRWLATASTLPVDACTATIAAACPVPASAWLAAVCAPTSSVVRTGEPDDPDHLCSTDTTRPRPSSTMTSVVGEPTSRRW